MDLAKHCSQCRVCTFLPEQDKQRVLRWHKVENPVEVDNAPVLVIDDAPNWTGVMRGIRVTEVLLGDISYIYTQSIRCEHDPDAVESENLKIAVARCGVWTHNLLAEHKLVIATQKGLTQMRIASHDVPVGTLKKTSKYGIVFHCEPLWDMETKRVPFVKALVARALKEVGL